MSGEVQKAEAIIIVVGGALAIYAAYTVYKTGQSAVSKVAQTASDIVESVTDTVSAGKRAVQNAYAETATFVTGQQHYSPSALDASLSRADAIKLADEINAREALRYKESISGISDIVYDEMGNAIYTQ